MNFERGKNPKSQMGVGIYAKWESIIDIMDIDPDYKDSVTIFANNLAENYKEPDYGCLLPGVGSGKLDLPPKQKPEFSIPSETIISTSLFIISYIKDLSKVDFLDAPFMEKDGGIVSVPSKNNRITFSLEEIYPTKYAEEMILKALMDLIVGDINSAIDSGKRIKMHMPIDGIFVQKEDGILIINCRSRYITYG